ncbi:hypothetical protein GGI07_003086 [Coemansia sp. Benny D115]|nr:hypothetical protein GGI07_003086 [Coemansia sp. Benny D115]
MKKQGKVVEPINISKKKPVDAEKQTEQQQSLQSSMSSIPVPKIEKSDQSVESVASKTKAKEQQPPFDIDAFVKQLHGYEWSRDKIWLHISQLPNSAFSRLRTIDINRALSLTLGSSKRSVRDKMGVPTSQMLARMNYIYKKALKAGIEPDRYTFQEMVAINVELRLFREAREWIQEMVNRGITPSILPYRTLLKGYSKVPAEIENARLLWSDIKRMFASGQIAPVNPEAPDASSGIDLKTYTCIITAECKVGNFSQVLSLLDEINAMGMVPDIALRNIILENIAEQNGLAAALEEARLMVESGYELDGYTYNILVDAAIAEGRVEQTKMLLNRMAANGFLPSMKSIEKLEMNPMEIVDILVQGNTLEVIRVYNALMRASIRLNNFRRVLQLVDHMRSHGVEANIVTYGILLDTLSKAGRVDKAKAVFDGIVKSGKIKPDRYIISTMIDACGRVGDINAMFWYKSQMPVYNIAPNEVIYNSILSSIVRWRKGDLDMVLDIAKELTSAKTQIKPTIRAFNSVFAAFSAKARADGLQADQLKMLRKWYNDVSSKYYLVKDSYSYELVMESFISSKQLDDAHLVYTDMVRHSETDPSVLYVFRRTTNTMLSLMSLATKMQKFEVVLSLWRDWWSLGLPESDEKVANVVLFACDQMGQINIAQDFIRGLLTPPEAREDADAGSQHTFAPKMVTEAALTMYIGMAIKHGAVDSIIQIIDLWRTSTLPRSASASAKYATLAEVRSQLSGDAGAGSERRLSENAVSSIIKLFWEHNPKDASAATDQLLEYVEKHFPESMPV